MNVLIACEESQAVCNHEFTPNKENRYVAS